MHKGLPRPLDEALREFRRASEFDPSNRALSAKVLDLERKIRHARFIRGRMSPALRQMKYMPEFRFRLDTSYDNFARIDELLRSPEVARDLDHDDETDKD